MGRSGREHLGKLFVGGAGRKYGRKLFVGRAGGDHWRNRLCFALTCLVPSGERRFLDSWNFLKDDILGRLIHFGLADALNAATANGEEVLGAVPLPMLLSVASQGPIVAGQGPIYLRFVCHPLPVEVGRVMLLQLDFFCVGLSNDF